MRLRVLGLALAMVAGAAAVASVAEEPVDLKVVHRVKEEAFRNSEVMDHLFYLTDVNGPRLTGSPEWRAAADWAVARLKGWGDRKSTRLNSSHGYISYAVFCLKKKKKKGNDT